MKKLLTTLMLLTFLVPIFGQKSSFIELLSDGSTDKKAEHFGKFKNMSSVKSLQLVKMGNLKNFIKGNYDQQFDTSKLKEGIYYLKLTSQNETKTIRIVHEK